MNGPVLRDIHVPPAGWWPPAPGWWVLAGIVVVICISVAAWIAWRRRGAPLRAALRELDVLAATHARKGDDALLVDRASRLMRRIARRVEPAMAGRTGAAWRDFVHRYARDGATRQPLDALIDARFRPQPVLDAESLLAALRAWCRRAMRAPHPALRARRFAPPLPSGERATSAQRSAGEGEPSIRSTSMIAKLPSSR